MKCLVIGGSGFLGYGVVDYLINKKIDVICFAKDACPANEALPNVKYIIGDVFDKEVFKNSLKGVDAVLDFVSTTLPSDSSVYLDDEINKTLKYHNYVLSTIQECGVKHYVFPSSGGAIYGNTNGIAVTEDTILEPCTAYGLGKKMVEDILRYYNQKFGMTVTVLRIGNVYGSKLMRERPQGVVDILIQKALSNEAFTVWGGALESKRDYVFLEDVADAVYLAIKNSNQNEFRVFNVGSGCAKSLKEIIDLVEEVTGNHFNIICDETRTAGVNQIVLSIDKIKKEIGWEPKTSLEAGVKKTFVYKKKNFVD